MTAVIEAEGLSRTFGAFRALSGVSFALEAGAAVALLGANGAGKTTLIGILLGLVEPGAGWVRVLGHDMHSRARARALARINFQSPYVDLPLRLTLRQNLRVYAGLYGVADPRERIGLVAEQAGVAHLLDRRFGDFSAGERTCAGLAKALLNAPEILILDEPTASLDPDTADRIRSCLEAYRRESGAALLIASHNMGEVERICSEVLMMRAGRIVARGAPDDLRRRFARDSLEGVFLEIARGADGRRG